MLQSPNYNIFDTTLWLDTLSSVLKSGIKILGVFKKEELIGGVVFNVIKRLGIKIANTPPMNFYNSLHYIPRDTQHKDRLGRYINDILVAIAERLQNDFHYVVITNHHECKDIRGLKNRNWRQNIHYYYRVDLDSVDLSLISASKRRQVKKAQKKLIAFEDVKEVSHIYNIIKNTYLREGLKCPLTLDEMSGICERMGDNIMIRAVREQGSVGYKAVIVCFVDYRTRCVYNLFNGYMPAIPDSGINTLLIWKVIKFFKDKGFECLDLGMAGSQSKANFKSEFNTDVVPHYQLSKSKFRFKFLWHLTKGRIIQTQ
ncbi:MAG: GNAT family N-acetyltransferase [Candidatus Scalindua sp.]|nr:GNAT family N-acetyltransferase [Candidatus Scalindua sp.]MBT5304286.1 GNAT family N-acetyltransferase [Candidatus Scalindua sp.]MBT6052023.1 GNAT family N-acetyltransferase [Candidatus Scalindua sp.]MBT6561202.1 GNAT family N-acetyltransferase [Candidatus Scalindua sp.]MBT7212861.1 GNAT family N-acetyltransferase [Candidatus Scalindua sp.]